LKQKPLLYRFIKSTVGIFYQRRTFVNIQDLPEEPSLIIGNHAQMHSPLTAELYFPAKKRIWCIGHMMSVKEVPAYAYEDFWSHKPKYIRWFFKLFSYFIAPLAAYIFTHADTIGVYKDARLISTFKKTVEALNNGSHIVIFPEYGQKYNHIVNEFQDKFIDVAKLYYKRFHKTLSFVPMYNAVALKQVLFGKPIQYDPTADTEKQRSVICEHLKQEITRLAAELPPHKVVTYENLSRKCYPMSR